MNLIIFLLFLVILLTGVPVAIAIGITTLCFIIFSTNTPLYVIVQQMYSSIDTSLLLGVLLFILAGNIMVAGKISEQLIRIGMTLLGRARGGLAISSVLACAFFAAISGSSPATVIAIGSIMMPALIRAGYHEYFSIGLLTSAGSVGILIPPSIPMIIYAMVMGISVTKQFLAGFIPGFLVAGAFILFSFILSARNGWRSDTPANWVEIKKALKEGIWGLSLPFIVLGGIYSGVFTPTEASAVAVVSALVIELFIYRSISFKQLPKIFKESTILASALLFIISAAGAMSWYVGLEQIPAIVAEWIGETIQQRWLFLLLVNVFLLCLGCVMDLVSGLLILGPIFLPLLDKFQIDPLHFGIIMMINMELGFCTPPYGLNLFVSSGVMKAPLSVVARGTIPFILLMFLVLQFITYVPSICSFLPALLE